MTRKRKLQLALVAVIILIISLFLVFNNFISAMTSRKLTKNESSAMLRCVISPDKNMNITINENNYDIPLPKNCAKYNFSLQNDDESKQYIAHSTRIDEYFSKRLTKAGWEQIEENGFTRIFKNKDNDDKFTIKLSPFTNLYYKIVYIPIEN